MNSPLAIVLASLAAVSFALGLWQWIAAWRFPLHRRPGRPNRSSPTHQPGITVLKPVKGCDPGTEECLRSWLTQDYPGPVQVLFGVASMDDPVVPLIQRLLAEHPSIDSQLVSCRQARGANAKVSTLVQLHELSKHPILCVSDADVWAPPDFLTQAAPVLDDPRVGLVNSFYELTDAQGFGLRWEALAISADFWSQVLQSASLQPLDFALGAAMVFRRAEFDRTGGFRPLADLLADDFHLGQNLARQGHGIELLPVVVRCRARPARFTEVWRHQLRWARTIRTCRPVPYFFSILANTTLWTLAWGLATVQTNPPLATTLVALLLLWRAALATALSWRLTQRFSADTIAMSWIKDLLQVGIWAAAFLGNTVTWRDISYRVDAAGRLTRIEPHPPTGSRSAETLR